MEQDPMVRFDAETPLEEPVRESANTKSTDKGKGKTPPKRGLSKGLGWAAAGAFILAAALAALAFTGMLDIWVGNAVAYQGENARLLAEALSENASQSAAVYSVHERSVSPRGYTEYVLPGDEGQRVWLSGRMLEQEGAGSLSFVDALVENRFTVRGITLSAEGSAEGKLTLLYGESAALTAELQPADAFERALTWHSGDQAVARVDAQGNVTAAAYGDTAVTAVSVSGAEASIQVHVDVLPDSVVMEQETALAYIGGEPLMLNASVQPEYAVQAELSWTSSDPQIAAVENGAVTGLSAGSVQIVAATGNGRQAACTVEVQVAPTGVILSEPALELTQEDTHTLSAAVEPADAAQSVMWTSSDEAVATVSAEGVVTALEAGTAVITAACPNGVSAQCQVTVLKKMEEPNIIKISKRYDGQGNLKVTVETNGSTTMLEFYYASEDRLVWTRRKIEITQENKKWYFNYPVGVHGGTHRFRIVAINDLGYDSDGFSVSPVAQGHEDDPR